MTFYELFASHDYPIVRCEWVGSDMQTDRNIELRGFVITVQRDGFTVDFAFRSVKQAIWALTARRMGDFWIPF